MKKPIAVAAVLAVLACAAPSAWGQDVKLSAPTPGGELRILPPALKDATTRTTDDANYPAGPHLQHDPAFILPFAEKFETPTSTGVMGLSGWTSPATPVGPSVTGYRDVPGWLGAGFSVTWGGPPPRKPAAAPALGPATGAAAIPLR